MSWTPDRLVEIRHTESKGQALFAVCDIPRGTRILEETPLVVDHPDDADSANLWKEFEKLTQNDVDQFNTLHCFEEETVDIKTRKRVRRRLAATGLSGKCLMAAVDREMRMRAIYNNNAVEIDATRQNGSALFPIFSRINHSCQPNVHHDFNPDIGKGIVHAIRDIKSGEEIVTSYISTFLSFNQRARSLRRWGFECDCAACNGVAAFCSAILRQRSLEIHIALSLYLNSDARFRLSNPLVPEPKTVKEALALGEEMVALLRQEGLVGLDLAKAYQVCCLCSVELDQIENAKVYALSQQEVEMYCLGPERDFLREDGADAFLRKFEKVGRVE